MASSGSFSTTSCEGRSLTFSWSIQSQSVANNTTTISWSLKGSGSGSGWVKCGGFKVIINNSTVYDKSTDYRVNVYNGTTIASGTHTITHNNDGTKSFSASAQAGIYTYAVNCSGSGSWALTAIPRQATITSAPDFNDEQNPTISYSNPAGNNVTSLMACISLTGSRDDVAYRNISKTGTSYTFNLTEAEKNVLRNSIPNNNSRTVKFFVRTNIGGVNYYSILTKTFTIINGTPTFSSSNVGYYDSSSTASTTGNNAMIVKNKSNLMVTYTAATAKKGASISSYSFTVNGVTKTSTSAGGTINFGKINSAQNLTLSASVTDSRGNTSNTVTKTITCYDHYAPSVTSFNAYRATNANGVSNPNGNYLYCTYDTKYASVNGTNNITVKASYTTGTTTKNVMGNNGVVAVDLKESNKTYTVYLQITDSYGGTGSSFSITVFGSSRALNVSKDSMGFAIGKMSEKTDSNTNGLFECRWDAKFYGTATGPSGFSTSSDERVKKNIKDINANIVDGLRPVQYELSSIDDGKIHYGFVAQEVAKLLDGMGIDAESTGVIGHVINNGQQEYVLTYTEFVPLLTKKCQDLQSEIDMLKQEIYELKNSIVK